MQRNKFFIVVWISIVFGMKASGQIVDLSLKEKLLSTKLVLNRNAGPGYNQGFYTGYNMGSVTGITGSPFTPVRPTGDRQWIKPSFTPTTAL